jgi:hypothetical protein
MEMSMPRQDTPDCHTHITAPETFARIPAVLQFNWAQAKRLQGHPISADRMALLQPHHLMSGPAARGLATQATVAQQIEPYHQRTQAKLTAIIARHKANDLAARRPTPTK